MDYISYKQGVIGIGRIWPTIIRLGPKVRGSHLEEGKIMGESWEENEASLVQQIIDHEKYIYIKNKTRIYKKETNQIIYKFFALKERLEHIPRIYLWNMRELYTFFLLILWFLRKRGHINPEFNRKVNKILRIIVPTNDRTQVLPNNSF